MRSDDPITSVDTPRLQALLSYLVLHAGVPQSRLHLAFLFWPDSTESQARTNLRQVLHHLRHALPEADRFIDADTQTVRWCTDVPFTLDVNDFIAATSRGEQSAHPETAQAALEEAVHLYRGDLLPSCYDEWIESKREQLRQQYILTLDRLVEHLEARRAYTDALRYAELALQKDPLRETTYRCLMRLHALRRDRASALRVYHECATLLERELEVAPAPTTTALYERLLRISDDPPANRLPPAAVVPLVGRQSAWNELQAAWKTACDGHAHVVNLAGEAGIGKTRLADELIAWAHRQGLATALARCYAAEGRLAFGPLAMWLRAPAFADALDRMDAVWRAEAVRLLPELATEVPALSSPEPMTEHWQRRRFFEALARTVLAAPQPLLLMIDDLQWCDQDTLEWLHYLLRFDPQAQLLVLSTTRIEEVEPDHPLERLSLDLRRTGQWTEILLPPLDREATHTLAEQVADRSLDTDQATRVYQETEGNPLFIVEGMRADMLVSAERTLASASPADVPASSALPSKVQAVLTTRLAQLSTPAHDLVGLAAAFGRSFTAEVLAAASHHDEETFIHSLDELWQRRILRAQGADEYDFSHDKLRDTAMAALSPARRHLHHRHIAQALEAVYEGHLDGVSGQIADHYERAGLGDRAIGFYQQAAEAAQRVHANEDAICHVNRALALLRRLPAGAERNRREFALSILLGSSLVATRGWADPAVSRIYEQARILGQERDDLSHFIPDLWELRNHLVRAELEPVRERGEALLTLGTRQDNMLLQAASHLALGMERFHRGKLGAALQHLDKSLASRDSNEPAPGSFSSGLNLGVFALCYQSHTLWLSGAPDQALAKSQAAEALADRLDHPFSRALALDYAAILYQLRRESDAARTAAEAAIAVCEEHGFAYYRAWGVIINGWTWADENADAAHEQMRAGIDELQATGAQLRLPYYWCLLTDVCPSAVDNETGLAALQRGLDMIGANGERWMEAELHRRRGALLQEQDPDAAERCFRRAVAVAQQQSARSLALRAATSLYRLQRARREHGTPDDARARLQAIYDTFTEGFDTADLQDARALLDETS